MTAQIATEIPKMGIASALTPLPMSWLVKPARACAYIDDSAYREAAEVFCRGAIRQIIDEM
jgi:hypothetical protein